MSIHSVVSRLLRSGAGIVRTNRSCIQCSAIRKTSSLFKSISPSFHRVPSFSSKAPSYSSIPTSSLGAADDSFEDEEEDSRFRYAPDGTRITRNNKKWLTKKKKKGKSSKVIIYKDIRDSTYNEIAEVYPQILEFDRADVKKVMAESAMYGFSPTKVAKIISRYPEFMDNYDTLLPNSARAWRTLGFSETDRVTMFHRHPALMDLSPIDVAKGYTFLQLTFSNKELVQLLKNCPQVIVENEDLLKQKIDLLWKTYSHSTLSIAKSDVLSSDEHRIKVRHEFLVRAGFFKPMPFHKFLKFQAECDRTRISKERDKYLPPSDIVCSSDDKFLDLCAKKTLSLTEFSIFETLFLKEEKDAELKTWLDRQDAEKLFSDEEDQDQRGEVEEGEEEDEGKEVFTVPSFHHQPWRYSCHGSNSVALFNVVDNVEFYF